MPTFQASLSIGIGDLIVIKAALDGVAHQYDQIHITPNWDLLKVRSMAQRPFVEGFSKLLFSEPPYKLDFNARLPLHNIHDLAGIGIPPRHPRLAGLLCDPGPSPVSGPYLVLHTKVRDFGPDMYRVHMRKEWHRVLRRLSQNYHLVLLGEREVQYNKEYEYHGRQHIYCIYDDLKDLPGVVDLTVPALGIDPPRLGKLQRDCAIMRDARACITLGHGGGPCLALACGKTIIGFRTDPHPTLDALYPSDGPQPGSVRMFYDNDSNNWGSSQPMHLFINMLELLD